MCGCANARNAAFLQFAHLHIVYINVLDVKNSLKFRASTIFMAFTVLYTKLRLYCYLYPKLDQCFPKPLKQQQ